MPSPTVRVAALAVGALLIAAAAEAGPARRGQVVRIERPRAARQSSVHLCVQERSREHMLCLGPKPPRIGARISLVSLTGMYPGGGGKAVQAWVTSTERSDEDRCRTGMIHAVRYRTDSATAGGELWLGLTGLELPADSHLVSPPSGLELPLDAGAGGYRPQLGIDTGNGEAPELLIGRRECRPTGPVTESECFGYFRAERGGWKLIGEDVYDNCR